MIDNNTVKQTILWVEDNAQDKSLNFIPDYIKHSGFQLREASGVARLARELREIEKAGEEVVGVILDMLIYGASDLSPFGMDVSWGDDATDVGMILIKHIFRNERMEKYQALTSVPIMILTVKPNVNKADIGKYKDISVAHKYDDGNPEWEKLVEKWVDKL